MSNFDPNAIIRGAQLTIVGAFRALQNPGLFKYEHYRQAALAVCAGILIRLAIAVPIIIVKAILWFLSLFINFETTIWDDRVVGGLDFLANSVLQVPFFLMTLMRYITPTLDEMFMDSLQWVDKTYYLKHSTEDPQTLRATYYPNLRLYPLHGSTSTRKTPYEAILIFLRRFGRRALISLGIYLLSYLPLIGRFVLPAASFYTFNKAVGPLPAMVIFGTGVFLPRRYLVVFLQNYFSSRSLMRELLEPYFSRLPFTASQKRRWFQDRSGLLFGFGAGFTLLTKIPILGVLIYGIAEASTAYLITKITDPPPPPRPGGVGGELRGGGEGKGGSGGKGVNEVNRLGGVSDVDEVNEVDVFVEGQVRWRNKHEFLGLRLGDFDKRVGEKGGGGSVGRGDEIKGRKFI